MIITHVVFAKEKMLDRLRGLPTYEPGVRETGATVLTKIFTNLFAIMTLIGGVMFFIHFLTAALAWISSSGQPEKVQKAQSRMINAAIGLIAIVAAYTITFIVSKVTGIEILNPAKYILEIWD